MSKVCVSVAINAANAAMPGNYEEAKRIVEPF